MALAGTQKPGFNEAIWEKKNGGTAVRHRLHFK
jgi:hypothetical protein